MSPLTLQLCVTVSQYSYQSINGLCNHSLLHYPFEVPKQPYCCYILTSGSYSQMPYRQLSTGGTITATESENTNSSITNSQHMYHNAMPK